MGSLKYSRNGSRISWQRYCRFSMTSMDGVLSIPSCFAFEDSVNPDNWKCLVSFIFNI